jgi:hypothetical protein
MKQAAQIKELLDSGMHSKCLFHFIAENKSKVSLICVRPNSKQICNCKKGDVIPLLCLGSNTLLQGWIELRDFYALMTETISLPNKLKLKEVIL